MGSRGINRSMKAILGASLVLLVASLSACSPTAAKQCEVWKEDGLMPSPLENCRICYDQLGGKDLNAIRSCSFALDVNDASLGLQ